MHRQWMYLIGFAIIFVCAFFWPFEKTRSMFNEKPVPTIILVGCFLIALLYQVYEIVTRHPEITFTEEGIELSVHGFYTWDMLESFNTIEYLDSPVEDLVLHLKVAPMLVVTYLPSKEPGKRSWT